MEIQAVTASERKTHVPEMQFHMRVVVSEIEETDSHVSPGQLLYKNEGVRTSIGAELVAAAALRIRRRLQGKLSLLLPEEVR